MRQKKKTWGNVLLKLIGCVLCGIVCGYLALVAVYAIPAEALRPKLCESMLVFDKQAKQWEKMDETLVQGYPSTWLDNTSDCFFLQYVAYDGGGEPLWLKALVNPCYVSERFRTPDDQLIQQLNEGTEEMERVTLSRYWHGYLIVLKPLLLALSYQDIRMLNMVALVFLMLAVLGLMYRRGLQRYLPALAASLVCLTPFVLPLNMHYCVTVYIALAGMLAVLLAPEGSKRGLSAPTLFCLLGVATSYFDMLTYPLITFGFPAIFWLLLNRDEREAMRALVGIGLAWLFGYAAMWAGKWALVALFVSPEEASTAISSLLLRSSAEEVGRLETVVRNLRVLWRKPLKLMTIAAAATALLCAIRGRRARRAPVSGALAAALLCVALLAPAWYFALANTNHVHYFFMHRALSVTVFALGSLLTRWLKRADGKSAFAVPACELR